MYGERIKGKYNIRRLFSQLLRNVLKYLQRIKENEDISLILVKM